jgi:pimeloyl-ACP methyl ester carboxylesterase
MFEHLFASFFKTPDNQQIFYLRNVKEFDQSKPILVFNYGLVCSNHHWSFQVGFFDKLGYQILLHDYRGHFQSTMGAVEEVTFVQLAKDIKNLCDHLHIKQAIFLGHSMGVNVSLQIAKDYPELVQSLVLISGTYMPVKDIMFDTNLMEYIMLVATLFHQRYPEVLQKIWKTGGLNPIVREIIHTAGFNRKKVSREFIEIYLNRMGQLGVEIFFKLIDEMSRQNITSSLVRIHVPTLVIGGLKDGVIPNHLQRSLANILSDSETYYLKTGSHVPQADFPEFINDRIELFFKQKLNLD